MSSAGRGDLARFERLVAQALTSADPVAAFAAAAADPKLAEELRSALGKADARGIRITALIVARLRFERLMHGSQEAADWFASDPAGFTRAFKTYERAVPPTAADPWAEAALWESWRERAPRL